MVNAGSSSLKSANALSVRGAMRINSIIRMTVMNSTMTNSASVLRGGNEVNILSGGSGDDFLFGGNSATDLRDELARLEEEVDRVLHREPADHRVAQLGARRLRRIEPPHAIRG